jgi:hypothetical protein
LHAFGVIFLRRFLGGVCEKWAEVDGFFVAIDGEMRGKRG